MSRPRNPESNSFSFQLRLTADEYTAFESAYRRHMKDYVEGKTTLQSKGQYARNIFVAALPEDEAAE